MRVGNRVLHLMGNSDSWVTLIFWLALILRRGICVKDGWNSTGTWNFSMSFKILLLLLLPRKNTIDFEVQTLHNKESITKAMSSWISSFLKMLDFDTALVRMPSKMILVVLATLSATLS